MAVEKTVLVEFQGHSRIVSFEESQDETAAVKSAIAEAFDDVFSSPTPPFFIQMLNRDWNKYVDLRRGQHVPDKARDDERSTGMKSIRLDINYLSLVQIS